jgi:hypothetical protein
MDDNGDSKGAFVNTSKDPVEILNSILESSGQRQVSENQIMIILDALAGAQDPALVSRFPAVLALCARRSIELSSQHLLGRYWESSPKRQNLEKLLFASAELFRRKGIPAPGNLPQIAESLKARHAGLASATEIRLTGGPVVAVSEMLAVLEQFDGRAGRTAREMEEHAAPAVCRSGSAHLSNLLDLLFPGKQKELVFKKLKGQRLTKTEREYYSRVVKKKLAAVADSEVHELAASLCSPVHRTRSRKAGGNGRLSA